MPTNEPALPKLAYSIKQASEATSLCPATLYNHIAAGRLRAVRVGGRRIIPAESLREFIEGKAA